MIARRTGAGKGTRVKKLLIRAPAVPSIRPSRPIDLTFFSYLLNGGFIFPAYIECEIKLKEYIMMRIAFMCLAGVISTVLLTSLTPPACAAERKDPAEGLWLSVDDKTGDVTAVWEFYAADGVLYGKIAATAGHGQDVKASRCKESYRGFPVAGKVNEMPVVGTPWIFGLQRSQPGEWKDGSVVNPESGAMFKCVVRFHAADGERYLVDTLEMRGEIGFGIGRSQEWPRATAADVERARRGW